MHLLIRAVSLAGQPLTQALSAYFDERGGTMGRSDTNTLALPDPERRISRLQAEVARVPEGWRLQNVGHANPLWHNNKPVGPGESVLLDEGDELQVGSYALQVSYSTDATARTITEGRAAVDARTVIVGSGGEPRTDPSRMGAPVHPTTATVASTVLAAPSVPSAPDTADSGATRLVTALPADASPFGDLLGTAPAAAGGAETARSPFDDLLGLGSPAPQLTPRAAASTPAPARLPDDFDPFADLLGAAPKPAQSSASPFGALGVGAGPEAGLQGVDLMGGQGGGAQGGATSSIDQLFGLGGAASAADPLAGFLARTAPQAPEAAPVGAPSAIDPMQLLQPTAPKPDAAADELPPQATPLRDDTPELAGLMPLPVVAPAAATSPVPGAEAANEPAPSAPVSFDDLLSGLAPSSVSAPVSVQPVELPALASQAERTVLVSSPRLVHAPGPSVQTPAVADVAAVADQADPLMSLSGDIALAEPVPVETLAPHATASAPPPPTPATLADDVPPLPAAANVATLTKAAPASSSADALALWSAFCQGAGIDFTPPQGLNPELMRIIGQVLRTAIDGSLKLVAARAATKQELRAEVTVIQAKGNNPLKFSPDAQSALEQLLQPPLRGFMPGPQAVSDAMDDLLGHVIGTMVGTRAALEGVLQRFEPAQLEAKLTRHSMIDSLLPMNRRAKLWELYLQHYDAVRGEAQEDFHNLFGKAFLQAYEEQLDRLDAERRAARATTRTA